jgi:hypothetical protein
MESKLEVVITRMEGLNLRELKHAELKDGAHLLCRGMRDNPNNVRAFGPEAEHRERGLGRVFWRIPSSLSRIRSESFSLSNCREYINSSAMLLSG